LGRKAAAGSDAVTTTPNATRTTPHLSNRRLRFDRPRPQPPTRNTGRYSWYNQETKKMDESSGHRPRGKDGSGRDWKRGQPEKKPPSHRGKPRNARETQGQERDAPGLRSERRIGKAEAEKMAE